MDPACRRPGCGGSRPPRGRGRTELATHCSALCQRHHRTAVAVAYGGAATGRHGAHDAAEIARLGKVLGRQTSQQPAISDADWRSLTDLYEVYGRP
jgi:hypothetical protein